MLDLDRLIIAFDNGLRTLLAPAHGARATPGVIARRVVDLQGLRTFAEVSARGAILSSISTAAAPARP